MDAVCATGDPLADQVSAQLAGLAVGEPITAKASTRRTRRVGKKIDRPWVNRDRSNMPIPECCRLGTCAPLSTLSPGEALSPTETHKSTETHKAAVETHHTAKEAGEPPPLGPDPPDHDSIFASAPPDDAASS